MRKKRDSHGVVPGYYEVYNGHKWITCASKAHALEIKKAAMRVKAKRKR